MLTIVFIVFALAILLCFFIRNGMVYRERIKMIALIFNQEDWPSLLLIRNQVSYDSMVFSFWIWPIHTMWPAELQALRAKQ